MSKSIYYALVYPIVNFSNPYFTPPSLTTFMNSSYIPPEFIPSPPLNVFHGWYVFQTSDPVNSLYKVGDVVQEDTIFNQNDYSYWVYPVWGGPLPPKSSYYPEKVLIRIGSSYANNLVYYKPHSLETGGTAGTRNSRIKSRRT
jgi:hypothetical protein